MSYSFADVDTAKIGALAPMVGADFHNANHHLDGHGNHEPSSYRMLMAELAPFISSDVVFNAADVAAGPNVGQAKISASAPTNRVATKAPQERVDDVADRSAIPAAVLASAIDAVLSVFVENPQQNSAASDGLQRHVMHIDTVVADMTDGLNAADIGLGANDPALAIGAAREFMKAKQQEQVGFA